MLTIRPNRRYNVIYYGLDGSVHTNNPDLTPPPIPGQEVAVSAPPTVFPASYNCVSPPVSTTTGPLREVYSTCNTPYEYALAYLPCSNQASLKSYEDGDIYSGGFSSIGNAVDAGFQFSKTFGDYQLFIVSSNHPRQVNSTRFQCNQNASVEFHPNGTTVLQVDTGAYTDGGQLLYVTQLLNIYASDGWSPACNACVVKRISSIAQNGGRTITNNGSYFGFDGAYPTIAWTNADVGYWNGGQPWGYNITWWTAAQTGGYRSIPADSSRVLVHYINPADETDGFNLHP